MDAKEMSRYIADVLNGYRAWENRQIKSIQTFEEAGVNLYYPGIVIDTEDDDGTQSQFQISVVKSK